MMADKLYSIDTPVTGKYSIKDLLARAFDVIIKSILLLRNCVKLPK